jgi:putative endonuclease
VGREYLLSQRFLSLLMVSFVAWVYIMTNESQSVLYTGFTTDLKTRVWEHSTKQNPTSFSAQYNTNRLVYFQGFLSVAEVESAEKYIKGKKREWKRALITKHNPTWRDLRTEI